MLACICSRMGEVNDLGNNRSYAAPIIPNSTPIATVGQRLERQDRHTERGQETQRQTTTATNLAHIHCVITKQCFSVGHDAYRFGRLRAAGGGGGGGTSCTYAEQGQAPSCATRQPQDSGCLHVSATTHVTPSYVQVTMNSRGSLGWVF